MVQVPHVCPLESVYDVARVDNLHSYVKLHPWTLFNGTPLSYKA